MYFIFKSYNRKVCFLQLSKNLQSKLYSFFLSLGAIHLWGMPHTETTMPQEVEGNFWTSPCCLLDWQGAHSKLLTWFLWGMPVSEGRSLIAYLIGRALVPLLGGLVIFLLFLVAARSWWKTDPLVVIQFYSVVLLLQAVLFIWPGGPPWQRV